MGERERAEKITNLIETLKSEFSVFKDEKNGREMALRSALKSNADYQTIEAQRRETLEQQMVMIKSENHQLRTEIYRLNETVKRIYDLQRDKERLSSELNKSSEIVNDLITEVSKHKSRADELECRCRHLEQTYTHGLSNWKSNVKELQNVIERGTHSLNHYQRRCSDLEKEKAKLYEDKQDLLKRVYGGPNLKLEKDISDNADLGDNTRTTKVAEEFAELYDNEWTDAFESLYLDSDRDKIQLMENVIQRSYELCKQTSTDHVQRVQDSLQTLNINVTCTESGLAESDTCSWQVGDKVKETPVAYKHYDRKPDWTDGRENRDDTKVITKSIKYDLGQLSSEHVDALLAAGHIIHKELEGEIADVMITSIVAELKLMKVDKVLQYVRKCVVICWAMWQHEPPLHLDFVEVRGDIAMDTSVYKPYTKTGRMLDYVVWPPLYLHENGPILAKGVAQAK